MEDRFLFKAKRLNNVEWVIGNLVFSVYHKNDVCIGQYGNEVGMHEVDSSTICQCTGLKDKNGKLIWENDIVKCLYNHYGEKFVYIGKVIYREDTCRFVVTNSESTDYEWWDEEKEVIGNIFDSAELLGRNDE